MITQQINSIEIWDDDIRSAWIELNDEHTASVTITNLICNLESWRKISAEIEKAIIALDLQ